MSDPRVSISRPSNGRDDEVIRISICDEDSGAEIAVEMTLAGFARALTGLARIEATQTRAHRLDQWGRKAVREHFTMSARDAPFDGRDAWCREQQETYCPAGFEFSHGGFDNRQQYRMTFIRWESSDE